LLARVVAVTFCVTLAASLAARHGPTIMAGFQICCQLWLATSLLADGLAVAGQVKLPSRSLIRKQFQNEEKRILNLTIFFQWPIAGRTCKCVCQERLQEGYGSHISCVAAKYCPWRVSYCRSGTWHEVWGWRFHQGSACDRCHSQRHPGKNLGC
jgi:hypothetical protein